MDNNFEVMFLSDAELEQAMDEVINGIKDDINKDEMRTTVLNPLKMQQFQFAYAALQYIMKDKNVQISYKMYEPFKTMGSITVEGTVLEFNKPEWFARIAEFASNTEIYPLNKNAVRMTFTFHGLTTPIE